MERLLDKIERLERLHDRLDPELVERKRVRLGLRKPDGRGVVAGITSKGQVVAFKRDRSGKNIPIPGKLIYCGYDVEDIVAEVEKEDRFGFEETVYLLLTGELPTTEDIKSLTAELSSRRALPELALDVIRHVSVNNDQMGALHSALSVLHKFDENPRAMDIKDVTRQCIDVIAKFPTILAYNYNVMKSGGKKLPMLVPPRGDMTTAESFLYMLKDEIPDDKLAKAFDLCLILHAEHGGGNNSTFTVRTVTSSLTDTYMALCAGVASLAGHLHGGANEAVMNMMADIKDNVRDWNDDDALYEYLKGILEGRNGDGSRKIFGMGHAVYTISDPREPILKEKARGFAAEYGRSDEFELYAKVADLAVKVIADVKGRTVCPNVDFYSGFVYDMMGIPQELFTPIFAMSRVSGWSAHRIEEMIQGKLIRPAYVSTLKRTLKYVPINKR
jgi:citrate synthase